jgi:hypothetical protein
MIENWKLWIVPFAAWGMATSWYCGYQSGYSEGHETAWHMARPEISLTEAQLVNEAIIGSLPPNQ